MMLFWKIRYLDRADKQFKDRHLWLDTETLDPVTRAALEIVTTNRTSKTEREILNYRHLFAERSADSWPSDPNGWSEFRTVGPSEYFEDETGKEMTLHEMGPVLTGSPTARFVPHGAKQHDLDFMFSERKPIPLHEVSLDADEVRLLGYFSRDLREMLDSAFMKDGPGSIRLGETASLETSVTDDEIRSFVTIFRRLYMTGHHDPASFKKVVPIYAKALGDHPYAKWADGVAREYQNHLDSVPDFRPFVQLGKCTFTTKRLIDVFLYTQYAHQPSDERQRQFGECLQEVQGRRPVLTWMFLTEIWKCSLEIGNAGRIISGWFHRYCDHHGIVPDVLNSLRDDHTGLGVAEKAAEQRDRLIREKVEELATELWKQNGRPEDGPALFRPAAEKLLADRLGG
jgi:Protein of unknown function (DUF2934)